MYRHLAQHLLLRVRVEGQLHLVVQARIGVASAHGRAERRFFVPTRFWAPWLSCSVTLEKEREPLLGKTIFSGAATKKEGKRVPLNN